MVLVGVQPVLMHVPPTSRRSISAVFFPAAARAPPGDCPLTRSDDDCVKAFPCTHGAILCDLLEAGYDQKAATDRDHVFDQSRDKIGDECALMQPPAIGEAGKGAGHPPDSTHDSA
jgi:hypothetical protein